MFRLIPTTRVRAVNSTLGSQLARRTNHSGSSDRGYGYGHDKDSQSPRRERRSGAFERRGAELEDTPVKPPTKVAPELIGKKQLDAKSNSYWEIGGSFRRVSVEPFENQILVSIRQFVQDEIDPAKFYPTKKGISLTVEQWKVLKGCMAEIDEAVDEMGRKGGQEGERFGEQ
ncbi:hypothetical protein G7K_0626-t1 [Saitoella complicata NRRL Y-17804]|uniref:Transcriptional coactivator p15 (PC4) C-terminal domain-containing protein n=1 Tax=Saitoella complicata (strain BCRC 22490 / CBS 7301 / JCM 7358 / NBRC 10748 / NRRL Y-17804) TaxID=698492 RepID=A0A0E9NAH7_SAICN|nr:hypothetical protein G7K_0626-t1 [Saitoella complicata NRRL Y-17804]